MDTNPQLTVRAATLESVVASLAEVAAQVEELLREARRGTRPALTLVRGEAEQPALDGTLDGMACTLGSASPGQGRF